jgi:hypothetical protein
MDVQPVSKMPPQARASSGATPRRDLMRESARALHPTPHRALIRPIMD